MRIRRSTSNESGQALVEFALVLPILLLVVFAIFEFGRALSAYQTITDTAREAARQAVIADKSCSSKVDDIEAMIRARLIRAGLDPEALDEEEWVKCGASGDSTTVTLVYAYRMSFLRPMIGRESISLRSATLMRQE